jgi:hypothetical protein
MANRSFGQWLYRPEPELVYRRRQLGAANGIVNGYSETIFGPDDAITREQLASSLLLRRL